MASRELKVEIVGDSKSLERAFGRSNKAAGGLQKGLGTLAKAGIAAGVALTAGLAVGIEKSIRAASNLEEQINKTNVVFRGSQKQVLEWSKGLERSFGLSQRAALEAAGTYGNMLVPMGIARDKAADMSEVMVQLAGDMASFNNASPADTLAAIQSGLAGQARPLRQYGVFLSEARTQQEAMIETGKKHAKELTDGEKALARYNLILKDTGDTQGDFARTSGTSLENQLRTTKALFEDLAASIGMAMLPIANKFLGFVNNKLIPGLSNAAGFVKSFWEGISNQFAKAPNFRAKVQVVFDGVQELASKFVHALISTIEGLLPQKPIILNPRLEARGLGTKGGGVDWDAVAADMIAALAVALQQSVALAQALATMVNNAIGQVDWAAAGQKMGPGFAEMLGAAIQTILDPSFWIKNWELTLSIAIVAFGGTLEKFGVQMGAKLGAVMFKAIARVSPEFAAALGRLISDAIPIATRAVEKIGEQLTRLLTAIFGRLTRIAVFTIKVLGVAAAIHAVEDFVRGAIAKFKEFLDWLSRLPGRIQAAIGNLGSLLYGAGVALIQGLWNGVTSKAGAFLDYLGGLASRAKSVFTLGLHGSPEFFTYYVGGQLMTDMAKGISEKQKKMEEALKKAIDAAKQVVLDAKSGFAAAFDELASTALEAFDKVSEQLKTPTERKIARQDSAREAADRKKALDDANAAVAAASQPVVAKEGESLEDFTARVNAQKEALKQAEQQKADALFAIQRASDIRKAEQERKALDDSRDLRRRHFAEQLQELERQLEKGHISAKKFRELLLHLFDKYDVPFKNAGKVLGLALQEGLADSFSDAAKLLEPLINAISKLKLVVSVEVKDAEAKKKGGKEGRALGGPVRAGSPYIVGERGPELFVPRLSGTIVPSLAGVSGGGMAEVHTNVYLDSTQIAEVIRREYLRFEKRNGRAAI